jgi:hypothetical protein
MSVRATAGLGTAAALAGLPLGPDQAFGIGLLMSILLILVFFGLRRLHPES